MTFSLYCAKSRRPCKASKTGAAAGLPGGRRSVETSAWLQGSGAEWLDELFDGVYVLNRERRIVFWNRGAEDISGYPRAAMLHQLCHEGPLRHKHEGGCRLCDQGCPAARAMEEGQPLSAVVYLQRADGTSIPVETHIRPLRDAAGQVNGALQVFRDFSQWKKMEALSLEKDRLMGVLAHDIRNPLTVIQAFAVLLQRHADPSVRELVEPILRKTKLAWALVDDLLDAQSIENGTVRLNIQDVDMQAVLQESLSNYLGPAHDKGIELSLEAETPDIRLYSDPIRLEEMFNNLISNAIHYSPSQTRVTVRVRAYGQGVEVKVSDQGLGISEDDQKKLFQAFGQTTNRPTGGESSHGLGLYIVKKLVDLFAGSISVESRPGEGTTFCLRFPYDGCALEIKSPG
jgi:PAS domain S-box-containing protein